MIEAAGMKIPTDMVTFSWEKDHNLSSTNYFETDYYQLGLCCLCHSCGHWELLVPDEEVKSEIFELIEAAAGSRGVIITRGLNKGIDTFQIRFVDDDEYPYLVMIETNFVFYPPEKTERLVRGTVFRIHQGKLGNTPVIIRNIVYNCVDTLPWVPRVE